MPLTDPMQSEVTLVDPTFVDEPADVFVMQPDNTNATTLYRRGNSDILYNVKTDISGTKTTFSTPHDNNAPLALLQRREIVSDKITFKGVETKKVKSWLKYGGVASIHFPATFEENGKGYIWKASIVGQLSLYLASDPDTPIAWFERSKKRVVDGQVVVHKAFLALQPEALEIQDVTVLSFLILEQKNRMAQKAMDLSAGRAIASGQGGSGQL
ncbi:hypothetical protein GALMADRAFT_207546 [Galerina marginata CBS 339.88]|uniref:DUF6593 domain-containing protein n=1 Tax=Galerina marginata (strain CBS 339.88) TaxID=685588 RepID=A0A067TIV5_GALM3|nr:hypothetical protein GALMADRAFT_207546 [Galerina marginata CBS 339.88]